NYTGSSLRTEIPAASMGGAASARAVFSTADHLMEIDFSDYVLYTETASLLHIIQTDLSANTISGNNNDMMQLEMTAYGDACTVAGLTIELFDYTTAAPGDLGVATLWESGASIATVSLAGGAYNFTSLGLAISSGATRTFQVSIDVAGGAQEGKAASLVLADVETGAKASITTRGIPNAYIGSVSSDVVVDGLFEDWTDIIPSPGGGENPNIDITSYSATSTNYQNVSVYLDVAGAIAAGQKIPFEMAIDTAGTGPGSGAPADNPPTVSSTTSDYQLGGGPAVFTAVVSDDVSVQGVVVEYYTPGYNVAQMVLISGDDKEGTYRYQTASTYTTGTEIEYTIKALDSSMQEGSASAKITFTDSGGGPGPDPDPNVVPSITDTTTLWQPIGTITISATITDSDGSVATATMNGLAPTGSSGDDYWWDVGQATPAKYDYLIVAQDNEGGESETSGSVLVYDANRPAIYHTPVFSSPSGVSIPITATVTNSPTSVTLHYTPVGGSLQSVAMVEQGGGIYSY
ncbi:MAG: hypothetical protein QCI38_08395, partial [Candidatus Thermoplasmatota archaeon]|nr:hypothetical protein [Candidatus Thermoplasmatota archaeon]